MTNDISFRIIKNHQETDYEGYLARFERYFTNAH